MSFVSAIPTPETQIGIGIESDRGTGVAAQFWLPVQAPKYKPDVQYLPDESLQGSMVKVYDEIMGLRYDAHTWDSLFYLDTLPVYLLLEFGSPDTVTAAPTNTTLSSAAVAGATTIDTAGTVAQGSWITVGTAPTLETRKVMSVVGAGPYVLTLNYPLAYAHADSSAVTGLTAHSFSLLNNSPSTGNQPPSASLWDYDGETDWRQLSAAQLNNLHLSGSSDALPKLTADWFANAAINPTAPSPSYSTAEASEGWATQFAIGGDVVTYLETWEFDFGRGVKPIAGMTGTQNYLQYFAGALTSTAKLKVLQDLSSTWLGAYEAGTTESLDLVLTDESSGWAINIHSSKAKFITGEIDRSAEYVEVPLEVQLLPTSTDATAGGVSPVEITVANAQTTAYAHV